jgi:cytochrome c oxidase assembly protein subunit 15
LVVTAILAGVSLDRLGVPAFVQPIHLLMANLIFGAQFFLYSCLGYAATNKGFIKKSHTE